MSASTSRMALSPPRMANGVPGGGSTMAASRACCSTSAMATFSAALRLVVLL
jgi:hypothetical protein